MSSPKAQRSKLSTFGILLWIAVLLFSIGLLNFTGSTNAPLIISLDGSPEDGSMVWLHGFPLVSWERRVSDTNGKVTSEIFGGDVTSIYPFHLALNFAFGLSVIVLSTKTVGVFLKSLPIMRYSLKSVFALIASTATVLAMNNFERFAIHTNCKLTDVAWQIVVIAVILSWFSLIRAEGTWRVNRGTRGE